MNKRTGRLTEQTVKRFCRRLTAAMLVIVIAAAMLLCGCADNNAGSDGTPPLKCLEVYFESYEQYAQSINDGWFFDQNSEQFAQCLIHGIGFLQNGEMSDADKILLASSNVIKPLVNGEELTPLLNAEGMIRYVGMDPGACYIKVNYPYNGNDRNEYTAYHTYRDYPDTISFTAELIHTKEYFQERYRNREPNYDAVINGEKVRIYSSGSQKGNLTGAFLYKDMYIVSITTANEELFDIIFGNLEIDEINVYNKDVLNSITQSGNKNEARTDYVWLWIVLGAVSVGAVAAVIVLKKRKQKEWKI